MLGRRAVDAVIWGMPIVSLDAMRQAYLRDGKAKYGDIIWWPKGNLEKSLAHAQYERPLPLRLLQHEGRRACSTGPPPVDERGQPLRHCG
jgi:hypothetical protein